MIGFVSALAEMKVSFPNFGSGDNIFKNGFTIDNVMFKIPGTDFNIYWYGFLIAIGILIAMVYCFKRTRVYGLNPDRVTDAVIGGLIGAVIGARFYYVIFSLDKYTVDGKLDWGAIVSVRDGGLAIYGGIIGALLVGLIVAKIRKCRVMPLLDMAAPGFLIGQCIGRWGNFFNQEAFGGNTDLPWGMFSSGTRSYILENYADGSLDPSLPVHPCFLYESIWCLIGFIILHFITKKRKFDGEIFLLYIGWYGLGRFFIEGLRTDSLYLFNIRVSQLVAGTCVLASVVLILIFRSLAKRNGTELYCNTTESVIMRADYTARVEVKKERKELSEKLKAAHETGDGITDITKEFNEKFGSREKEKEYIEGVKELIITKAKEKEEEKEAQAEKDLEADKSIILADEDKTETDDDHTADETAESFDNDNNISDSTEDE